MRLLKIYGIWPQTHRHTYTRASQCSHASVGLAQARPNYTHFCHDVELKDLSITPVSTLQLVIILQPTITAMVQNIKYFHILQLIAFTFRQPLCTCCKDQNTCNHHLCQLHSCSSCTSAVEWFDMSTATCATVRMSVNKCSDFYSQWKSM